MLNKLGWGFGVALTAAGILGFVPGVTTDGHLLGIFDVDTMHNLIHIVTGLVALAIVMWSPANIGLYFKVFGVVYGLVTIIGFVQGTTVLGLISINMADNVLHLLIAALALYAGFVMKESPMPVGSSDSSMPTSAAM